MFLKGAAVCCRCLPEKKCSKMPFSWDRFSFWFSLFRQWWNNEEVFAAIRTLKLNHTNLHRRTAIGQLVKVYRVLIRCFWAFRMVLKLCLSLILDRTYMYYTYHSPNCDSRENLRLSSMFKKYDSSNQTKCWLGKSWIYRTKLINKLLNDWLVIDLLLHAQVPTKNEAGKRFNFSSLG